MKKLLFALFVLTSFTGFALSDNEVFLRLMIRKNTAEYCEGASWTRENVYINRVMFDGCYPGHYTGSECFSFMMDMMEFASSYKHNIGKLECSYSNLPEIHVGDGLRLNGDRHSVVVIAVDPDGHTVTVVEGNYNGTVHWGRKIDLADPENGFTYLYTFWK